MNPELTYVDSDATWNEEAERRMADLATFADGLVHDIRNPLNVIRSNLYLLRQRLGSDDPRTVRALDRIDDQVTAELQHLEGVQAFYRSDRPSLQRVQLNDLVKATAASESVPEGCELTLELDEELPLVTADPQLIDAALRALLRNAMEAVAANGPVRIVTSRDGSAARLQVRDGGPGIPADVLPHVFEPLFTTQRAHAGLGLSLVAKVARAHHTTARVGSGAGAGTVAELELNVAEPAS